MSTLGTERLRIGRVILAIETSNPSAWGPGAPWAPGVGVYRESGGRVETLGEAVIDAAAPHEGGLMVAISGLIEKSSLRPADVGTVAVSVGPGGFTAVRIAVTTAKMIAEATGALCVPVPTARVAAIDAKERTAVALASKGSDAYVQVFDAGGVAVGEGRVMDAAAFEAGVGGARVLVADAHVPSGVREAALRLGMRVEAPVLGPGACVTASLGIEPVDPALLLPIYPREPEAVTKWREMKARGKR